MIRMIPKRALLGLSLGLAAVAIATVGGLYLKLGRPSAPSAAAAATTVAGHPHGDVAGMIAALEARMKEEPGDAEGWRMLGWSYVRTGRNADAAKAYGRAAALDPRNADYLSSEGEATVLAADGQVTPAAETAFRKALAVDPADPRARYYLAVARDQKGDAKGAIEDWIAMLKTAPPDAAWAPEVRDAVEKSARARGMDISARLPPVQTTAAPEPLTAPVAGPFTTLTGSPSSSPTPGPSADQVAAAGQMSDHDRQAMIQGMVEQLSTRLKTNPRDRAGWERLIRSRMVLGQPALATAAYRDAGRAFAGSPSDQAALRSVAADLGVPGA